MPITLSKPMQAALARAETKHSELVQEYQRLVQAEMPAEYLAGVKNFIDESWRRIVAMRAVYGGRPTYQSDGGT